MIDINFHNNLKRSGAICGLGCKNAIVVGAGISGLTAAYRLQNAGFSVQVLEACQAVGGRATTVKKSGYSIDPGASAVVGSYRAYLALVEELGLGDTIVPASQYVGIVRNKKTHYFNTGRIYWSGLCTSLLSWRSKFRLARAFADTQRAKKKGQIEFNTMGASAPIDVETTEAYSVRRLNKEISDYFSEPVVRGMMLANADQVSKVELFHGLNNIYDARLYGVVGGVKTFSDALAAKLDVKLGASVTNVRETDPGIEVVWQGEGAETCRAADVCVLACPLPSAAAIYPQHGPLKRLNDTIRYGQCISVAIGTSEAPKNKCYVLQVPRVESETICYIFLEHNKGTPAAPEGHGLITAYLADPASKRLFDASDDVIVSEVLSFLEDVLPEIRGAVDMTHVVRWPAALPLNEVGAYHAVNVFREALSPLDPVQFACDYVFSAVGQSIAVEAGNRAAANLIAQHQSQSVDTPQLVGTEMQIRGEAH